MDEERAVDIDEFTEYASQHTICVDGVDIFVMPFIQLRSLYSTLFPNKSSEGMSYEEIVNCTVKRLVFILLNKESPESLILCVHYV